MRTSCRPPCFRSFDHFHVGLFVHLVFSRMCHVWTGTPVKWSWWTVSGRLSACSPSTAWLWRNGMETPRIERSMTSPTSSRVRHRGMPSGSFLSNCISFLFVVVVYFLFCCIVSFKEWALICLVFYTLSLVMYIKRIIGDSCGFNSLNYTNKWGFSSVTGFVVQKTI